jgi:hypothetical protein
MPSVYRQTAPLSWLWTLESQDVPLEVESMSRLSVRLLLKETTYQAVALPNSLLLLTTFAETLPSPVPRLISFTSSTAGS